MSREGLDAPTKRRLVDYLRRHVDDLSFSASFWKECEPNEYETGQFSRYAQVIRLSRQGAANRVIHSQVEVGRWSVGRWTRFEQKPKLAHYLAAFLRLGKSRAGWVWLSINNSPGHAVPYGQFIQVPKILYDWHEVAHVLSQVSPLEGKPVGITREYMFGFLLGMVIGDTAKSKRGNWHRHLDLTLSMKYDTNERIGEFTSACARNLGLRMHRISDRRGGSRKPHDFFNWVSQSSALVDWIFNVCLGLEDGQLTTYDSVRMDWVIRAPREFRKGLLQGIAESDGSVSIASQTVEFWIGPNWDFARRLLLTFGVRSFRSREALSVTKTQIPQLFKIPAFSPLLRTVRYTRFEKLAQANHIKHGRRIPREIRKRIMEARLEGVSVPRISEMILDEFRVVLTFEAVQRWARRARTGAEPALSAARQA